MFWDLIIFYVVYAYLVWIFYLAILLLKTVHDEGHIPTILIPVAYFTLFIGIILDFTLNVLSSIPFMEFPKEFLLTQRCNRLIHSEAGWRKTLALGICRILLDPFELKGHCR